ncbi:MAG: DUF488 family protein [Chloroflexota bacterium]
MIYVQRVYQEAKPKGRHFLIDRLWPRGIKKEDLSLDGSALKEERVTAATAAEK